ncbi:hypothetical protein CDL15_Pgr021558 [Punica granatum]|uniref:Acid phosphatase/vanadium-dependent haloperoxidase-related protein n=1 Tax=Punica granatum TaxID=22663 RepID=A0A218WRB5_PUNGR|nr:hypothetical protein CDL15_Pgr021558 [Punica granatum]
MDEVVTGGDGISSNPTSSGQAASLLPYNLPLFSAFLAFALAQFLKLFTTWNSLGSTGSPSFSDEPESKLRFKERRWDSKRMIDSGGMPSSHSATVMALAVAIGLQEGAGAPEFAIAVVLACIVMYDASGIRHHAGRQAELLNQIVCEFPPEHPLSSVRPLRELLGHTPLQQAFPHKLNIPAELSTINQALSAKGRRKIIS